MKNVVICPNCRTENPLYKYTCSGCKAYLRDKIFNLDLWQLIGMLIESPVKAFTRIIQSEHKNFIILITVLFSIRAFINSRFISILLYGENSLRFNLITALLISAGAGILIIWMFTFILFALNKISGLKTRLRDNNAVLIYSALPYSFALIVLFPIELIIFGGYLFSNNPSPFMIKPAMAITLLSFEGLLVLWGFLLSVTGIFALSRSTIYAVTMGIAFNIYLWGYFSLLSVILFI
jgi:hypothetical protein